MSSDTHCIDTIAQVCNLLCRYITRYVMVSESEILITNKYVKWIINEFISIILVLIDTQLVCIAIQNKISFCMCYRKRNKNENSSFFFAKRICPEPCSFTKERIILLYCFLHRNPFLLELVPFKLWPTVTVLFLVLRYYNNLIVIKAIKARLKQYV